MANAVYPKYKQALLDASANVDLNDGRGVKERLLVLGIDRISHAFRPSMQQVWR